MSSGNIIYTQHQEDIIHNLLSRLSAAASYTVCSGYYRTSIRIRALSARASRMLENDKVTTRKHVCTINSAHSFIQTLLFCQYLCVILGKHDIRWQLHETMIEFSNLRKNSNRYRKDTTVSLLVRSSAS